MVNFSYFKFNCALFAVLIFQVCSTSWAVDIYSQVGQAQPFQIAQDDNCGYVKEIPGDIRTLVPWNAAIFGRRGSRHPYQFQLSGTLVSPSVVVTLFGGEYGKPTIARKYFVPRSEDYLIAVGLKNSDLRNRDEHTQISEVSYILPFNGHKDQKEYHFFVFHLKNPVNTSTSYVTDLCIPIFLRRFFKTSVYGRVKLRQSGFEYPPRPDGTRNVVSVNATLEAQSVCESAYLKYYDGNTDHVLCGKETNRYGGIDDVRCVEPGSGIATSVYNNRWFLGGFIALIPSEDEDRWCRNDMIYFYGRMTKYMDWFLANIKCSGDLFPCSMDKCIPLSSVCDQKQDCPNGDDEDQVYCRGRKPCIFGDRTWECGVYGKCISISEVCDGKVDCENGSDETLSNCPSKSLVSAHEDEFGDRFQESGACPNLISGEGVDISCERETGEATSCRTSEYGHVARYTCKKFYKPTYRGSSLTSTCHTDGTWKPSKPFICQPECGIIGDGPNAFIFGGNSATKSNSFPWHAAIFRLFSNQFQFICGGSLIEKSFVVTAAHCVTDPGGAIISKSQFQIAVGTNSSMHSKAEDNPDTQIVQIKNIHVPATFDRRTLQSDIALLELEKPVAFGQVVRPVCYFETGRSAPPPTGAIGKVAGFGFEESNKISERLLYAEFPVIDVNVCRASLKSTPPLSTFCAGYTNGTAVCQGDSGGGMVFATSAGKYFLKGIVSHGEAKQGYLCDPYNYAVFTHMDAYADWVLQRLENTQ